MKQRMKVWRQTHASVHMRLPSNPKRHMSSNGMPVGWRFCYQTFTRATGLRLKIDEEALVEINLERVIG